VAIVRIETDRIVDWASFHAVLAEALRFPAYYGRNGNAFVDCLWDIVNGWDVPPLLGPRETLTIDLGSVSELRSRCPEQVVALGDGLSS
jgi:RNAse (barnase) inhibitor barstar